MKKILYWTAGLHLLFFGNFLAGFLKGFAYKELDDIANQLHYFDTLIASIKKILEIVFPWM